MLEDCTVGVGVEYILEQIPRGGVGWAAHFIPQTMHFHIRAPTSILWDVINSVELFNDMEALCCPLTFISWCGVGIYSGTDSARGGVGGSSFYSSNPCTLPIRGTDSILWDVINSVELFNDMERHYAVHSHSFHGVEH
ncbi:hypothetical protein CEXT_497951 [Caerostris extrusa]|uniref:Uncharacterized protein n=1 Tax=Caerostris extrusa TaxID=172846 RepID=A0AAV4TE53_CAEEX|nr:hypothetical protein CEXT_497951 [Caerostris extrusa]